MDALDQIVQEELNKNADPAPAAEAISAPDPTASTDTPVEGAQAPEAGTPAPQAAQPDTNYDQLFEEISGGMFKTRDELTAALPKIQQYDELQTKLQEYEAKLAENPFADDYERRRNELKKGGASKEQLAAFERVNDLGDLNQLDAREAKVMKLMLVDGYKESVARRKVEKDFPQDEYMDAEEREELEEELRISSKNDLEALQAYKVQVETVPADDQKLHQAAQLQQIEQTLTPVLEDFKAKFTSFGEHVVGKTESGQEIKYNLALTEADRDGIARSIQSYFTENAIPVTQENYDQALAYARMNYLDQNLDQIIQRAVSQVSNALKLEASDRFQNHSGLPKGDRKGTAPTQEHAFRSFQDQLASGQV